MVNLFALLLPTVAPFRIEAPLDTADSELSVVLRRGTRTLSCLDSRPILAIPIAEFDRAEPDRVVFGAWKSSTSWL